MYTVINFVTLLSTRRVDRLNFLKRPTSCTWRCQRRWRRLIGAQSANVDPASLGNFENGCKR